VRGESTLASVGLTRTTGTTDPAFVEQLGGGNGFRVAERIVRMLVRFSAVGDRRHRFLLLDDSIRTQQTDG
jgi:hypothetical protein